MKIVKVAAVALMAVALASCSSPESRIKSTCVRNGGLNNTAAAASLIESQCSCFAKQLKSQLPDDQLNQVAKLMELPRDQQEQAARTNLTFNTSTALVSAAKSCAVQ
jgi:hypothetical protein